MNDKMIDIAIWIALSCLLYLIWKLWVMDMEDADRAVSPTAGGCRGKSEFKSQYPVKLEHEISSSEKACIAVGICDELTLGYYYDTKLVHGWKEDLIVNAEKAFAAKNAPTASSSKRGSSSNSKKKKK